MAKYAVLIKHFARDMGDVRIEIVNVPSKLENICPYEVEAMVRQNLLGPFEIIAVTDRIYERDYPSPTQASESQTEET